MNPVRSPACRQAGARARSASASNGTTPCACPNSLTYAKLNPILERKGQGPLNTPKGPVDSIPMDYSDLLGIYSKLV